jgi:uncharacterized protein DUF4386
VIFAFLINFIGDVVAAWGLYLLLRPVNASISMFVAWLRLVYTAVGLAAVLNLVTAHRLLTRPAALTALGQNQLNAQVHVAIDSFNSQFAFSLIIFGVCLVLLGWLAYRSGFVPKWLGIVLVINGAGLDRHEFEPLSSAGDRPRLPLRRDLRRTDPFGVAHRLGHTTE